MDKTPKDHATTDSYSCGIVHLALIFIIVIAAIGGVGYFMYKNGQLTQLDQKTQKQQANNIVEKNEKPSPTSKPTSNWKTYTNEEYGLSFKYPKDWQIVTYSDFDEYTSVCLSPTKCATPEELQSLDIYSGLIEIGLGPRIKFNNPQFSTKIGINNNINANLAEEYTGTNHSNSHLWNKHVITYSYEIEDGWTNSITFTADIEKGEDEYLNTFNKILSTFKFTE